jgi:hypothetical protein
MYSQFSLYLTWISNFKGQYKLQVENLSLIYKTRNFSNHGCHNYSQKALAPSCEQQEDSGTTTATDKKLELCRKPVLPDKLWSRFSCQKEYKCSNSKNSKRKKVGKKN